MGLLVKADFKYNYSISSVHNKTIYSTFKFTLQINQVIYYQLSHLRSFTIVKITILSMYPYTIVTVPYIVTTKYYRLITSTAIG